MVHPYLQRREQLRNGEAIPDLCPDDSVRAVLARTLGVPIFQEQVMQLAIVAAGFTPGEADQLRRSMAAWRRKGGLEVFQEKILTGMAERGYPIEFAQRICQQIQGFGEYGFPESHSFSFALLVYVSSWLKCHEPAAFACALLNSQPMGFYSPSQLIQDARRHGVELRPADVEVSEWDCVLEPGEGDEPALRLGLRLVKGLSRTAAERLVAARDQGPFQDVADMARRSGLDARELKALVAANALESLAGHRRSALWQAAGVERLPALLDTAQAAEPAVGFAPPTEAENLVADYASLGLTLGRHPLALLRPRLTRQRMTPAADLQDLPDGRLVRVAGLVTCRQRPGTASGVVFVTMEDETGMTNVVVWDAVARRQRQVLLGASLLGVYGQLQRQGGVTHVIASRLVDLSSQLGELASRSRDFH